MAVFRVALSARVGAGAVVLAMHKYSIFLVKINKILKRRKSRNVFYKLNFLLTEIFFY